MGIQASGGTPALLTDSATASFIIWEVNDAPIAVDNVLDDLAEDTPSIIIPIGLLVSNDSTGPTNETGQTLSISAVADAQGGTVQIVGSDIVFTLTANYHGVASFNYTIVDDGTTNGLSDPLSDQATASFTIWEVNDAPNATDDILGNVAEDTPSVIIPFTVLLANDTAGPANENGQTVVITSIGSVQGGTTVIAGDDVIFTPTPDYNGPASFQYMITDSGTTNGTLTPLTDQATASFTIYETNDAPVATDDQLADIAEDSPSMTIPIAVLLGNDSPGSANENDQTLTLVTVANAQGGTVQIVGSDVIFTPTAEYNGAAGFEYSVQDDGTTNGAPDPLTDTASNGTVRFENARGISLDTS